MSKNIFIFLLLNFFVAGNLFAQHRGDNWCLSDSVGLNFIGGAPTLFNTGLINRLQGPNTYVENTSCISNENGQLLYYSDGENIWDKNNDTIPIGERILSDFSVTNGSLFIPVPNHEDSLTYHFYLNRNPSIPYGLYFSEYNSNLRGGNGDIWNSQVNILLFNESVSEQVAAIKHGNGVDWWLLIKKQGAFDFLKILVSENGFSIDSQQVGAQLAGPSIPGEMVASLDGSKIGICYHLPNEIQLFNFDRCTGALSLYYSDTVNLSTSWVEETYGCSFSPDGSKFYYSSFDTLYQLNLLSGANQFSNSVIAVVTSHIFAQNELAPDGKIYISISPAVWPNTSYTYTDMHLTTIDFPNLLGTSCGYDSCSFYLGGKRTTGGLPNMPNYNLGALEGSACDTLTSIQNENLKTKNSVSIYPNPATEQLIIHLGGSSIDNGQFTITEIEISDVMGRIIYEEQSHTKLSIIHCQLFPPGFYFIKINFADGETEIKKMVKE